MSTSDDYKTAMDALGDAIRSARERLVTRVLALEKRTLEKQLRGVGYTKEGAKEFVSRTFKIEQLGDN